VNAEANIDTFLLKRLAEQSGQCLDLASVLLATDEMLNAAQGGHWDRVSELESSRRKRLDRCFAQTILPENSELFSEALAVMLHLNEELVLLIERAKVEASVSFSKERRGQRVVKHYLDVDAE
jgi:hypothetical protein